MVTNYEINKNCLENTKAPHLEDFLKDEASIWSQHINEIEKLFNNIIKAVRQNENTDFSFIKLSLNKLQDLIKEIHCINYDSKELNAKNIENFMKLIKDSLKGNMIFCDFNIDKILLRFKCFNTKYLLNFLKKYINDFIYARISIFILDLEKKIKEDNQKSPIIFETLEVLWQFCSESLPKNQKFFSLNKKIKKLLAIYFNKIEELISKLDMQKNENEENNTFFMEKFYKKTLSDLYHIPIQLEIDFNNFNMEHLIKKINNYWNNLFSIIHHEQTLSSHINYKYLIQLISCYQAFIFYDQLECILNKVLHNHLHDIKNKKAYLDRMKQKINYSKHLPAHILTKNFLIEFSLFKKYMIFTKNSLQIVRNLFTKWNLPFQSKSLQYHYEINQYIMNRKFIELLYRDIKFFYKKNLYYTVKNIESLLNYNLNHNLNSEKKLILIDTVSLDLLKDKFQEIKNWPHIDFKNFNLFLEQFLNSYLSVFFTQDLEQTKNIEDYNQLYMEITQVLKDKNFAYKDIFWNISNILQEKTWNRINKVPMSDLSLDNLENQDLATLFEEKMEANMKNNHETIPASLQKKKNKKNKTNNNTEAQNNFSQELKKESLNKLSQELKKESLNKPAQELKKESKEDKLHKKNFNQKTKIIKEFHWNKLVQTMKYSEISFIALYNLLGCILKDYMQINFLIKDEAYENLNINYKNSLQEMIKNEVLKNWNCLFNFLNCQSKKKNKNLAIKYILSKILAILNINNHIDYVYENYNNLNIDKEKYMENFTDNLKKEIVYMDEIKKYEFLCINLTKAVLKNPVSKNIEAILFNIFIAHRDAKEIYEKIQKKEDHLIREINQDLEVTKKNTSRTLASNSLHSYLILDFVFINRAFLNLFKSFSAFNIKIEKEIEIYKQYSNYTPKRILDTLLLKIRENSLWILETLVDQVKNIFNQSAFNQPGDIALYEELVYFLFVKIYTQYVNIHDREKFFQKFHEAAKVKNLLPKFELNSNLSFDQVRRELSKINIENQKIYEILLLKFFIFSIIEQAKGTLDVHKEIFFSYEAERKNKEFYLYPLLNEYIYQFASTQSSVNNFQLNITSHSKLFTDVLNFFHIIEGSYDMFLLHNNSFLLEGVVLKILTAMYNNIDTLISRGDVHYTNITKKNLLIKACKIIIKKIPSSDDAFFNTLMKKIEKYNNVEDLLCFNYFSLIQKNEIINAREIHDFLFRFLLRSIDYCNFIFKNIEEFKVVNKKRLFENYDFLFWQVFQLNIDYLSNNEYSYLNMCFYNNAEFIPEISYEQFIDSSLLAYKKNIETFYNFKKIQAESLLQIKEHLNKYNYIAKPEKILNNMGQVDKAIEDSEKIKNIIIESISVIRNYFNLNIYYRNFILCNLIKNKGSLNEFLMNKRDKLYAKKIFNILNYSMNIMKFILESKHYNNFLNLEILFFLEEYISCYIEDFSLFYPRYITPTLLELLSPFYKAIEGIVLYKEAILKEADNMHNIEKYNLPVLNKIKNIILYDTKNLEDQINLDLIYNFLTEISALGNNIFNMSLLEKIIYIYRKENLSKDITRKPFYKKTFKFQSNFSKTFYLVDDLKEFIDVLNNFIKTTEFQINSHSILFLFIFRTYLMTSYIFDNLNSLEIKFGVSEDLERNLIDSLKKYRNILNGWKDDLQHVIFTLKDFPFNLTKYKADLQQLKSTLLNNEIDDKMNPTHEKGILLKINHIMAGFFLFISEICPDISENFLDKDPSARQVINHFFFEVSQAFQNIIFFHSNKEYFNGCKILLIQNIVDTHPEESSVFDIFIERLKNPFDINNIDYSLVVQNKVHKNMILQGYFGKWLINRIDLLTNLNKTKCNEIRPLNNDDFEEYKSIFSKMDNCIDLSIYLEDLYLKKEVLGSILNQEEISKQLISNFFHLRLGLSRFFLLSNVGFGLFHNFEKNNIFDTNMLHFFAVHEKLGEENNKKVKELYEYGGCLLKKYSAAN
jgi:hypothetical protein